MLQVPGGCSAGHRQHYRAEPVRVSSRRGTLRTRSPELAPCAATEGGRGCCGGVAAAGLQAVQRLREVQSTEVRAELMVYISARFCIKHTQKYQPLLIIKHMHALFHSLPQRL